MVSEDKTEFFENGFEDFPRKLPENCVEYMVFIIDSQVESRKLLSDLEAIRKAAVQLCERFTKGYIWQRDVFQLQAKNDKGLVYLHGTTDYGDSVEDEWLVVFLLRELSKSFPNLWIRVFDSDGEFLLVEAANVLPKWLSPEIDSNRVWLHQGGLRILPLAASSGDKRPLSLTEAIGFLKTKPADLINSAFIEAEAFYRLEKYPAQITNSLHTTPITIPRKLAYILHESPATIAPAVEAFYLRDPLSLKPLMSLSGNTHFPPQDLVTVSVKFTKVLFAQVKSQQFKAPPSWSDIIDAIEREVEVSSANEPRQRLARLELGMKVTSGFEMLATSAGKKDNRLAREFALLLEDLEEDGDQVLPTDEEIQAWPEVNREDDETWLDINFEDFENELEGRRGAKGDPQSGFGDATTQADLQKMVSRFEAFLNDETAGIDGAELEDMDEDDDSSDEEDDSEDEDKDVSFDEEEFAKMMREMMGMPSEKQTAKKPVPKAAQSFTQGEGADEDEDEEIRQLTAQMEAELKEHGALKLDPTPKDTKVKTIKDDQKLDIKGKGKEIHRGREEDEEEGEGGGESGDEDIDIDYNLAKNLLESFKSQAGMAGPTSNILGLMGMQLPRDEDEEST
ncbi:hypothetical protein SLS62_005859 [Diatrype stigma]|uniref:Ecdysoneless n=1 Tax=Diatrype stigma TaxID=117547 RepID=A0AAN9URV1_9PEZI